MHKQPPHKMLRVHSARRTVHTCMLSQAKNYQRTLIPKKPVNEFFAPSKQLDRTGLIIYVASKSKDLPIVVFLLICFIFKFDTYFLAENKGCFTWVNLRQPQKQHLISHSSVCSIFMCPNYYIAAFPIPLCVQCLHVSKQ